jgi:hypothetical protein
VGSLGGDHMRAEKRQLETAGGRGREREGGGGEIERKERRGRDLKF